MPYAALERNRMQINHSCCDGCKDSAQLFSVELIEGLPINFESSSGKYAQFKIFE
jgi:hypothetical protein